MTSEQIELLEDKIRVWSEAAKYGNMELRDYNRRAAEALRAALDAATFGCVEWGAAKPFTNTDRYRKD